MAVYLTGVGANSISVTYAGATLTSYVKSVTINYEYDDVDITPMASAAKLSAPGLLNASVDLELFEDFSASATDATISGYLGSTSGATLVIQSSGTTVTTTNPKWTMTGAVPFNHTPINGSVGDASMTSITFKPVSGTLTRATS